IYPCRVSPFGDPRIEAWSAAPRGLSQPPTSFIGIWRQGIHRWLFVAWNLQDARARYAVLKELARRDDAEATARCCSRCAGGPEEGNRPRPPRGGPGAVPSKRNSDDR